MWPNAGRPHCRHPLYTGLLLSAAGFTELTQSPSRALTLAGLWWLLSLKAAREEQFLVEKFGSDYGEKVARMHAPSFASHGRCLLSPWPRVVASILGSARVSHAEEYRAKTPKFLPDGRALVDKLRALLKPSSNKD